MCASGHFVRSNKGFIEICESVDGYTKVTNRQTVIVLAIQALALGNVLFTVIL